MTCMRTLDERIEYVLSQCPLNQKEIAAKLGIKSAAISQWRSGGTKSIRPEHLFPLARITGFNAEWIGTGVGPERYEDNKNALNTGLLSMIITTVIKRLDETKTILPPESLASIIDILYTNLVNMNQQSVDEYQLNKLINLAILPSNKR